MLLSFKISLILRVCSLFSSIKLDKFNKINKFCSSNVVD